jgi:hypothetical protein
LRSKPENIAASDVPALLGPGFDALRRPVWVFDDVRKRKLYANRAAVELWGAASLDELLARDFSDQSPAIRMRMEDIARRIEGGDVVEERWTFYPNGAPVAVQTAISRIALPDGGHAMLFEAVVIEPLVEEQRAIEALRHTSALVSLYDADGFRVFGNPAALAQLSRRGRAVRRALRQWRRGRRAVGLGPGRRGDRGRLPGDHRPGRALARPGRPPHARPGHRSSPASWSTRPTSPKRSRRSPPWPKRASGPRPPWPPARTSWPI